MKEIFVEEILSGEIPEEDRKKSFQTILIILIDL